MENPRGTALEKEGEMSNWEETCRYCGRSFGMSEYAYDNYKINVRDIVNIWINKICQECAGDFSFDVTKTILDAHYRLKKAKSGKLKYQQRKRKKE
jgi:hypothetical protein